MNLNASDFISMMVTQLQNQDPLQPTDSSQLLSQMSQIGQLQSSTQLQTTLSSLMLQSQLTSAGGLIGKSVQGMDAKGNAIKGVVNSVSVKSDGIYLKLDTTQELSMSQVTQINSPAGATATAGTPSTTGS
jgi:flagellar basal-body rod modification protein FlgD